MSDRPLSLVTGACGFIGTHMVEVLNEANHRIIATDLPSSYEKDDKEKGRFPSVIKKLGIEFIPSDMTKPSSLDALLKDKEINYVFHIASVFNYTTSWEVLEKVNVEGTKELCNRLLPMKSLKRFVLWGAGGVYGAPRKTDLPIKEDLAPNPPNNYLKSKWRQEFFVIELGRTKKFPYTIIRPTGVYGPRCVYGAGQLFRDIANMKVIAVPKNFTARIPFVHVRDVCNAALFLSDKPKAKGEIFNINDDSQMTNVEFMKFMAKLRKRPFIELPAVPICPLKTALTGVATVMEYVSNYIGIPSKLEKDTVQFLGIDFVYSNEKLKKLGYNFLYPNAEDGIRETIEWYEKEGWL